MSRSSIPRSTSDWLRADSVARRRRTLDRGRREEKVRRIRHPVLEHCLHRDQIEIAGEKLVLCRLRLPGQRSRSRGLGSDRDRARLANLDSINLSQSPGKAPVQAGSQGLGLHGAEPADHTNFILLDDRQTSRQVEHEAHDQEQVQAADHRPPPAVASPAPALRSGLAFEPG